MPKKQMPPPRPKLAWSVRKAARKLRRRVGTLISRYRYPVTAAEIEAALDELIEGRREFLMVHSSLSACGYVESGPETIIRALEARTATLVLPTHTYCYPPVGGGEAPLYDARRTPSRVGKVTDVFWRQAGTLRSLHPTHSVASRGDRADDAVCDHLDCVTPCGRRTPYERLVQYGAGVLMFGATMNTYTFFHTAEDCAECPYLYYPEPYECRAVRVDTEEQVAVRTWRQDMRVARRFKEMDRVLQSQGLLRRRRLGRGELLYMPSARDVHEFLMDKLQSDPFYLVAQEARSDAMRRAEMRQGPSGP